MKKSLFLILAALMLLPLPTVSSAAGEEWSYYPFEISEIINLSDTGATPGPNSAHGNHQTRTVHTSHGDFAAYITGSYNDSKGTVDTWSLFKIDSESGEAQVVFTGEKYYDSSQVSLLVDKDENVWAITASSDNYRNMKTEGVDVRAHRYDAKTGEVSSYTSLIAGGAQDGYGYATSYYDKNNDRIIALLAGGDYKVGSTTGASFNWVIFDMKSNRWTRNVYSVKIPSRHCYMFGYVDEAGGLMFIAQRDIKCTSLGYPEIGNDTGITSAERDYMYDNKIFRWSANYCWDELDLYYIPNVKEKNIISYNVITADYSRVLGTQEERNTFEKRLTNYYPENHNNNGGDFLLTVTDDGRSLLHITYNSAYIQAAMYRPNAQESIWYHQVWDVTDPQNAVKLYNAPIRTREGIADGTAHNGSYSFRLYEGADSKLYLISAFDPATDTEYYKDGAVKYETPYDAKLIVYRITEDGDGYTYKKLPKTVTLSDAGSIINISSHRGGSARDNKVNILYMNNDGNGDYIFTQLSLSDLTVTLGDINGDGEINGKDSNLLKQIISGVITPSDMQFFAADISCDENINGNDANLLTRLLAGENTK